MTQIDLNADMAEGFGAYDIGDDAAMLDVVTSANVACGFHAGDPSIMRRVVAQAAKNGVGVGAHPGFNDLWGFGRRPIQMRAADLENMVAYQIGALQAIAACEGTRVTHVKPHGALSNMAAVDADYAMAIARAIRAVDRELVFLAIAGTQMAHAGRELGLKVALEAFCDRMYEDDGNLTPRKIPGAVHTDPARAVAQVLDIALRGKLTTRTGKTIACEAHSLCVHGDEPTGVAVARAVREALAQAGVQVVPLHRIAL